MAAESGRGFLVKIGDGGSPETYSTLAGMRTTSMTVNAEIVDVTNKDSAGWRELLSGAGVRRMSVSGAGVFADSQAESLMRSHALAGSVANYQIVFENGDLFSGAFQVASLDYSGDHNGERTYTLSLESAGPVSVGAAA